jgi:MFS family permease
VVERIGLGLGQAKLVLVAGSVWFADGAELLLISAVTDSISETWSLSSFELGVVVSLVYVGVLFGNMIGGPIGDVYGRRVPIVSSYWLIFALSLASAASSDLLMLCVVRLLVGVAMGIGQPACQALISETTPAYGRVLMMSLSFAPFAFGEMYSAILIYTDDPDMDDLHWRWLLVMGALPAASFGLLALMFVYQSPYFLSCNGRFQEARDVLTCLASDNSNPDLDVAFDTSRFQRQNSADDVFEVVQLVFLLGQEMLSTTFVMVYSCFVLNFTFYGCLYAFSNVMSDIDLGTSSAISLITGAVVELVGVLMSIAIVQYMPRRAVMKTYLFMTSLCLVSFACAASGAGWLAGYVRFFAYYGTKFFVSVGYIVAYVYVTEVYPASCRSTGSSVCLAGGRIGTIVSPIVFEVLEELSGGFECFFYVTATLAALNFCFISFLVHETHDMLLQETAGEAFESARETPKQQS